MEKSEQFDRIAFKVMNGDYMGAVNLTINYGFYAIDFIKPLRNILAGHISYTKSFDPLAILFILESATDQRNYRANK